MSTGLWCVPQASNLMEGRSGPYVNWVITGQEQMPETQNLWPEVQGDPWAGPLQPGGLGEGKTGVQPLSSRD